MHIIRRVATVLSSVAIGACVPLGASAAEIRLLPDKEKNYYAWIVFLS